MVGEVADDLVAQRNFVESVADYLRMMGSQVVWLETWQRAKEDEDL
jgi:hypothetical protein